MDPDLKEWVKRNSCLTKEKERFSVYELNTTTLREDKERKIREVSVGPENDFEVKTVLLVGESGAGKTAFLNGFLNVVFGVDISDEVRLELKEQSPPYHTTFLIRHQKGMPYPFNYKVVDTLGLGDGDHGDKANQEALKNYLSDQKAISHLNCVALVWKASSQRLDERTSYILSKIKKFMSPDMKFFTDVLVTFSLDENPNAIAAVKDMEVAYNKVFFFENAPLYECPSGKRETIHSFTWESMVMSHKKFLENLNESKPQDLRNTANHYTEETKREHYNALVEATRAELSKIKRNQDETSNQVNQLNQRLSQLEEEKQRKFQELKGSNKEIFLENGEYCHYCRLCGKYCKTSCRERHDEPTPGCWDAFCKVFSSPPQCHNCRHRERDHVHKNAISANEATDQQRRKFLEDQTSDSERIEKRNLETELKQLEKVLEEYKQKEKSVTIKLAELQEAMKKGN